MKVFISADIEGTAGITNWDEARKPHADYPEHRQQMTREVLAACDGANAAGAKEILIKDAHATGRNILQADLPENVRLIRGWSGHPMSMVQELDKSFDAALFIGYHSKAGDETNPLAHTLTGEVMRMRINGVPTSEFLLHAYAAATVGVPVVFVSGDWQLCTDIKETNPNITAVAVSEGIGPSTVSLAPKAACAQIREGVSAGAAGRPQEMPAATAGALHAGDRVQQSGEGVQVVLVPRLQAHRRAHHPVRDQRLFRGDARVAVRGVGGQRYSAASTYSTVTPDLIRGPLSRSTSGSTMDPGSRPG